MFDKIPSLKDFIIYLIPGALICYFSLNIFNIIDISEIDLKTSDISKDSVLIFIGILISFLVGFITSQIQIIIFNHFINRNSSVIRTINRTSLSDEFKERIAEKIIIVFNTSSLQTITIKSDPNILHLCLNYIKSKANDETNIFINRSSNLSSFASASTLPLFLGILNFTLQFEIPLMCLISYMIISLLGICIITFKITINFRREWINSVYKQFLIL